VGAVVGGVHDDGVVGDAQLVQLVEHDADVFVVSDHYVVVLALAVALALVLVGRVGPEVHGRGVPPDEERLVRLMRVVYEAHGVFGDLVVDGLHPLPR
jgi:hypothetical protein